ncbi:hypothetical protein EVG16_00005, partial [Klebsiella pneumoniae]
MLAFQPGGHSRQCHRCSDVRSCTSIDAQTYVGTLTEDRAVAMRAAVEHARQAGKPWTLDPVA